MQTRSCRRIIASTGSTASPPPGAANPFCRQSRSRTWWLFWRCCMTRYRPMAPSLTNERTTRRQFLGAAGGLVAGCSIPLLLTVRPAGATSATMATAIREVIGEATVREGKVKLDVPPLVENGNTVSLGVSVDSPMNPADYVKTIFIFNEKNPLPNVANFHLGPRAGKASVATRIRLADSQQLVAIAQLSDGSFWSASVDVIVTLAACVETL